ARAVWRAPSRYAAQAGSALADHQQEISRRRVSAGSQARSLCHMRSLMIPASFDYIAAKSLDEAISLLATHKDDAKILAGGHSLLPAMKLRLMQPKVLIDLARIPDLRYIREQDGKLRIGAMSTHYDIESSKLLADRCPLLPQVATQIGDVQVRNKGTIGGSIVHSD